MRVPAKLIAAALVVAACASSSDVQRFRGTLVPGGFQVMSAEEGEVVLTQCRSSPVVSGVWVPTAADIAELERRLPAWLAKQQVRPSDRAVYLRQYVGFVFLGRRWIYLNAFPAEHVRSDHEWYVKLKAKNDPAVVAMQPYLAEEDYWRRHSIMVCDGGSVYWGVEYDALTKQFTNLNINGEA